MFAWLRRRVTPTTVSRPSVPDYAAKLAYALDHADEFGDLVRVVPGVAPPTRSSRRIPSRPHPEVPDGAISLASPADTERGISHAEPIDN